MSELKIGVIKPRFYADVLIANQTSLSGTDILADGFQGFFPSTRVNYTRIGLNVFVPIYRQFGSEGLPADGIIGNLTWSKMPADPNTPVVKRG